VKHWPILTVFGMQHHENKLDVKRVQFIPPHLNTVARLPCKNHVVVWPFTTMNLC